MPCLFLNGNPFSSIDPKLNDKKPSLLALIETLRETLCSDEKMITSITVNSNEVWFEECSNLSEIRVLEEDVIEIKTQPTKDALKDLIHSLKLFSAQLVHQANKTASVLNHSTLDGAIEMNSLIDGLNLFLDGVKQAKVALSRHTPHWLETELLEILEEMVSYYSEKRLDFVSTSISDHLVPNLQDFEKSGLDELLCTSEGVKREPSP